MKPRSGLLAPVYSLVVWLGLNTVLGTMNSLLLSFYSQEPFISVFATAQLTTHTICILVELVIFFPGTAIYRWFDRRGHRAIPFMIVVPLAGGAALLGAFLAQKANAELLGLTNFSSKQFFNLIYGSILIAILLAAFDRWLRSMQRRRLEMQAALREARLHGLQNRMRPHFLFNALNSVHSLLQKDPERADAALLRLADNYRFLLGPAEQELISFDEEWSFTLSYVELERVRFGDRMDFQAERDGDFAGVRVPPLSIQPLVENAFVHGLRQLPGTAVIRLTAGRTGDQVTLTIEDNGPGVGTKSGDDLFAGTLGNIRQRMRYFDSGARLTVETCRPQDERPGTRAVLNFHAIEKLRE